MKKKHTCFFLFFPLFFCFFPFFSFFLISRPLPPPTPSWLAPLVEGSPFPFSWVVSPPLLVGGALPSWLGGLPSPFLGWAVSAHPLLAGRPPLLVLCPSPVGGPLPCWWGGGEGRGGPPPPSPFQVGRSSPPFLDSMFLVGRTPLPSCLRSPPSLFAEKSHSPLLGWVVSPPLFFGGLTSSGWSGGLSPSPAFMVGRCPLTLLVGRSLFVFWAGWSPRSLPGWAVFPPLLFGGSRLVCLGSTPSFPLLFGGSSSPVVWGVSFPSWLAPLFGSAVFPSSCLFEKKRKEKIHQKGRKTDEKTEKKGRTHRKKGNDPPQQKTKEVKEELLSSRRFCEV